MIRPLLLRASRSDRLRNVTESTPITKALVSRYVAGETEADAVRVATELADSGRLATIDFLGEGTTDAEQAAAVTNRYITLLGALGDRGLADRVEVSLKLSAIGQALPGDGQRISLDNARRIAQAAAVVGTTVTVDMEDHTTTDATLAAVRDLRVDFPWVGTVLQAYLRRTEADCRDLAHEGSRVRLCKGAYKEPSTVAYTDRRDIDVNYVRCMKTLLAGDGHPMLATHDPRLIDIASMLVVKFGRRAGTFEYQMLYGVRPEEQQRLADAGESMRVYVPYGTDWYGYMIRRMAEKPSNLALFTKSLTSKR